MTIGTVKLCEVDKSSQLNATKRAEKRRGARSSEGLLRSQSRGLCGVTGTPSTLMRVRFPPRYRPIIDNFLTHVFLTRQPEASLASLGTGTLNKLGSEPKAGKHEEGENASHRSLHVVARSDFRSLKDIGPDAANLSPLPVAGDGRVLAEKNSS